MMDTMRSRNGYAQPNFGYGSSYDGIQFSDPWARTSAPMSTHIVAPSLPADSGVIPSLSRSMRTSLSSPFSLPATRPEPTQPVYQADIFNNNDVLSKYNTTYAEPTSAPLATAGSGGYMNGGYGSNTYEPRNNLYSSLQPLTSDRRLSHPSIPCSSFLGSPVEVRQRQNSLIDYSRTQPTSGTYSVTSRDGSLNEALDSARGMMALSQADSRSIAGSHRNSSTTSASSYYPGSTTSSISSATSYPYFGSMDSTGDISTDGMYDSARPSLPRPAGMISSHGLPHQSGAQSMMSTFNSRVSSSTQKKHKCKICDKRFTRPSSLQTHMYSHTGEKPFACDVEGCGRQFSVVSNLRRHRKVHKNLPDMDSCSNHSG